MSAEQGLGGHQENRPRLGVLLLDLGYEERELSCSPDSSEPRFGSLPPGFFEHPQTWGCPTIYRVAEGCTLEEMAAASPQAGNALRTAAETLGPRVDLVTADCAWTWFRRDELSGLGVPVITSGLALLDLARRMSEKVAIVALSEVTLLGLMKDVPSGVRIIGLDSAEEWVRFRNYEPDMSPPIDQARMGNELMDRLHENFSKHGKPGAIVLECTALPQFRSMILNEFQTPVLDILSFVHYLVGVSVPDVPALAVGPNGGATMAYQGRG